MTPRLPTVQRFFTPLGLAMAMATLALLSGCDTPPQAPSAPSAPTATMPPLAPLPLPPAARAPEKISAPADPSALARSSMAYRKDAARHLYGLHAHRIYRGRLPPMLEAVGVLAVDIDPKGSVKALNWMRAPKHAPHVMAEIERMVKASAPYPAPAQLGQVTYTDVWLWHKSGKFQLDTLTEGQD